MGNAIIFWFASWVFGVSMHCMQESRLTLCDCFMMVWFAPLLVALLWGLIYIVIWHIFVVVGIFAALAGFGLAWDFIAEKLPLIDIRKFCLVLWEKNDE